MTVSSAIVLKEFTGDGVTTDFSTSLGVYKVSDLVVASVDETDGAITTYVLNTDYTVNAGGLNDDQYDGSTVTVTFVTAPASAVNIKLLIAPDGTQASALSNSTGLSAESMERIVDRLAQAVAYLQHQVDRSVKLDRYADKFTADIKTWTAAARANQYLATDGSGNVIFGLPPDVTATISAAMQDVVAASTILDARNLMEVPKTDQVPLWDVTNQRFEFANTAFGTYFPEPEGWAPYAFQPGFRPDGTYTTAKNLSTNPGALVIPIFVPVPMIFTSIDLWNTDTASLRSAEWKLYRAIDNDGGTNTELAQWDDGINAAEGSWSFTPTVASKRNSPITGASDGVLLAPGLYWLAIRNTSVTQTFGIGSVAAGTLAMNTGYEFSTLSAALDTTLDLASAAKVTAVYGVILKGNPLGIGEF